MSSPIRKYHYFHYQVIKLELSNGYGWNIYNKYQKLGREIIEHHTESCDTESEAEQDALDAISCHYDNNQVYNI